MQTSELYEIKNTSKPDDIDVITKSKHLEIRSKPKYLEQLIDLDNYQKTPPRLIICGLVTKTTSKWKRWATYSIWEKLIVTIAVIVAVVSFIISLIQAWPDLINMFKSIVSIASAAESPTMPTTAGKYAELKDFIINGFAMVLCLYSAIIGYHSKETNRSKFARDIVKVILGFLFGRQTR